MATRTFYSEDADILAIRPDIVELGGSSFTTWEDKHVAAFAEINRKLVRRWYRGAAEEYGVDWRVTVFNPDLVLLEDVVTLSCYKALELIYLFLMNNTPEPDGFERQMILFRDRYNEELKEVLSAGISYDWGEDDTHESTDLYIQTPRRLTRA
jgi:hypothetical protein